MTTQKSRKLLLAVALVSAGLILPSSLNEAQATATTPVIASDERTDTRPVSSTTSEAVTETVNHATTVTTTSESNVHQISFGDVRATVFLNCTYFWITVTPSDREYSLVLTYLDAETGQRFRILTGSLIGKSSDPFGRNGFLLLEVEVRVVGRPSVAVHLPRHCLETRTPVPQGSRSASTTADPTPSAEAGFDVADSLGSSYGPE